MRAPIARRSCVCEDMEIRFPAQMKRRALNMAWVMRWKMASFGRFRPRLAIITPSWLRVERAMIFFMSDSSMAASPAMNIVKEAISSVAWLKYWVLVRAG